MNKCSRERGLGRWGQTPLRYCFREKFAQQNIDSYKDLAELLGNTKNRLTIRILGDILLVRDIALQDAKYGNAESGYMKRISL